MFPAELFLLVFVPRILGEEDELLKNLAGYRDYARKVRCRLIPGIW